MSASRIFFYSLLCFVFGIFLSSFFNIGSSLMLLFLIVAIALTSVFWKNKAVMAVSLCLLAALLGIWRHSSVEDRARHHDFRQYNASSETVELFGLVVGEPDIRQNHTKLELDIRGLTGKILVNTEHYPAYYYGDKLKIKGALNAPGQFNDFNYQDYLMKDGIYAVVYYPEIELISRDQGNFFYAGIFAFKNRLRETINKNLSPPESSILSAMILGDKRQISPAWQEKLNYSGLRHLTAVSGMHVAILTVILMSLLLAVGCWRSQAFYLTVLLLIFFVAMTGFQPSAVRASLMAGLVLLAQYIGKMSHSLRGLVLIAAIMLFYNPLLLRLDVGFQLSFLAMLGIIFFLPFFRNLFNRRPGFQWLKDVISASLSAQIFTLPILIYNFGYFSLVGLITNLLVVPLLPFIMGFGFIFVLLGLFSDFLAWLISLPLWLLLRYLILVVDWFSGLKFSAYFIELAWPWLIICYLCLGLAVWQIKKREKRKLLRF